MSITPLSDRAFTPACLFLIAGLMILPACDQSPKKAQRDQAEDALAEATEHMNNAASGGFHTQVQGDQPGAFDIEKYRLEQLGLATQSLGDPAIAQVPAMHYAASSLGSSISASEARNGLNKTLQAWTLQTARATRLIGLVSAIKNANVITTEQAKVDHNHAIVAIRNTQKKLVARNDGLQAETRKLRAQAAQLREGIAENNKTQQALIAEADKLSRQAYTAKGQMQYDLYIQAAGVKQNANRHASAANLAEAELSIVEAQLKINAAVLTNIKEQVAQAENSVQLLADRSAQRDTQVRAASEIGQKKAAEFDEVFKQFAQLQLDSVVTPLQTVNEKFEQAVAQSQTAMQASPGSSGALSAIHHYATRAEYGNGLSQQAMIHAAYAQTLQTLSDSLGNALPNRTAQIKVAIADANKAADAARESAKTHLTESDKELETLADGGPPAQRSAVLRNRIAAHHALARVTEDTTYLDRAKSLQQQLDTPDP